MQFMVCLLLKMGGGFLHTTQYLWFIFFLLKQYLHIIALHFPAIQKSGFVLGYKSSAS